MPSYSETLNTIYNLRGGEVDLRLHRVEQALSLFDHPERCCPVFHIAGTNGKGSTAAMLHSILCAQGYRAALYTSPHLTSFTERIRVGQGEILPDEVVEIAESLTQRLEEAKIFLTFFEFVTVMAMIYFAHHDVDVAVLEVGMGGRLDATNLVVPGVSIITTVAKDHEAYLGSDLDSIAREKGGIIKEGVPVVGGPLETQARVVIEDIARIKGCPTYFFGRDFSVDLGENDQFSYDGIRWHLKGLSLGLRGVHQRRNAASALAALELMQDRFPVDEAAIRQGLERVYWPGRLEIIGHTPVVILDGAHNMQGVKALVHEVRILVGGRKVKLLFGVMKDKDWSGMLTELTRVADEIVLTRVPMERSGEPELLHRLLPPGLPVKTIDDPMEAVGTLLGSAGRDEVLLVTGSLYLLGQVRPFLVQTKKLHIVSGVLGAV